MPASQGNTRRTRSRTRMEQQAQAPAGELVDAPQDRQSRTRSKTRTGTGTLRQETQSRLPRYTGANMATTAASRPNTEPRSISETRRGPKEKERDDSSTSKEAVASLAPVDVGLVEYLTAYYTAAMSLGGPTLTSTNPSTASSISVANLVTSLTSMTRPTGSFDPAFPLSGEDMSISAAMAAKSALTPERREDGTGLTLGQVVADEKICLDVVNALTGMNTIAGLTALADIEEGHGVEDLRSQAAEILKDILTIHQFKRKHPDWDVDSFSFSRTKEAHLLRLGIQDTTVPVPIHLATFKTRLHQTDNLVLKQNLLEHFEQYWRNHNHEFTGMYATLKARLEDVATKHEAKSRVVANELIFEGVRCMKEFARMAIAFLELNIATKKSPAFVTYDNDEVKYATYLTGTVDYAVMCTSLQVSNEEDAEGIAKDLTARVEKITDEKFLDDLLTNKEFLQLRRFGVGFSVFELKARVEFLNRFYEKNPGDALAAHKPQVYAETIAMMKKLKVSSLPWCLTNGLDWIFGAIEEDKNGRHVYCLKTISLDATNPTESDVRDLFLVLMVWISQPAASIIGYMKTPNTTSKI